MNQPAGRPLRRAVIIVPGYGQSVQGEALERMHRSLCHYSDGWMIEDSDSADEGLDMRARRRADGQELELTLFETFWSDLIPTRERESPWSRLQRGTGLIWFWIVSGNSLRVLLRGKLPSRTIIAFAAGAVALLIWYASVLLLLISALQTGDAGVPAAMQDFLQTRGLVEGDAPTDRWSAVSGVMATVSGLVVLVGALGLMGPIERLANVSDFLMAYLRDDPVGTGDIGVRALARHRLIEVLDRVAGPPDGQPHYDEIAVVGHSLGGAIAMDALAEYGDAAGRITLFTWGSALGMLAQKEPKVEAEIAKFYRDDNVLWNWQDVVFQGDYMGSVVPVPRPDPVGHPKQDAMEERFPRTRRLARPKGMTPWSRIHIHEQYFRSEVAIKMLLARYPRRAPVCEDPDPSGGAPEAAVSPALLGRRPV